jgi:hypothetical protein
MKGSNSAVVPVSPTRTDHTDTPAETATPPPNAAAVEKPPETENWVHSDGVSDHIAANDFEKQLMGRLDTEGVKCRQMKACALTDAQKDLTDADKEAKLSEFVPSGRVTWNTNKKEPRNKSHRRSVKTVGEGKHVIECDMFNILELANDQEEIALFGSIPKDVQVDFTLLNPSLFDEKFKTDVMLQPEDILHIEIAETPDALPGKLWQLERLFIHFDKVEKPVAKVAVICSNGKKTLYDEAVKLALEQIKDNTQWVILKKIPVYVLYTPNRNVYRSLFEIEKQLKEMVTKSDLDALRKETKSDLDALRKETKSDLDALRKEMATNQDALATKLDNILAKMESRPSLTKIWRRWRRRWTKSHGGDAV